jgi:hypothetical protein
VTTAKFGPKISKSQFAKLSRMARTSFSAYVRQSVPIRKYAKSVWEKIESFFSFDPKIISSYRFVPFINLHVSVRQFWERITGVTAVVVVQSWW